MSVEWSHRRVASKETALGKLASTAQGASRVPRAASRADRIVFFAHDVSDSSTAKRVEEFIRNGYNVLTFAFRRHHYNHEFQPTWAWVPLGRTWDGHYARRLAALLRAIPHLLANRKAIRDAKLLYARNLDQLLLAIVASFAASTKHPIAYEVADIQPALFGTGIKPRLLRAVERVGLRRVTLLVLSSPGFLRNFYRPLQTYLGEWFLLENKLPATLPPRPVLSAGVSGAGSRSSPIRPWIVEYAGLIRGESTFDLVSRLASRLQGVVLFRFHGVFTTVSRERFMRVLSDQRNILYGGPYVYPSDLARVYEGAHFAWAVDLENPDNNSSWLLPCRFYEAGYFGVPCLTVRGFEIGRMVAEEGVGWSFGVPLVESMARFFLDLTRSDYEVTRRRLLDLPLHRFVGSGDTAEMIHRLKTRPLVGRR